MPSRPTGSILNLRHPAQYVVLAFTLASVTGGLLLWIPAASADGGTSFVTALFTATSAVCVTGLVLVDTSTHWSAFGEGVILMLIQVGGFGIMTLTSLIVLALARRLGLRQRLIAASETGSFDLADVRRVLVGVAVVSISVEVNVAAALFLRFWTEHDLTAGDAAYASVFHAVSAFNNAGFSLFHDSLAGYASDPVVLLVVAFAVIVGGLGFPVLVQMTRAPWAPRRWGLHTQVTVFTTVVLLLSGWALLAWFEWTNAATLGQMSAGDSLLNAFFHSVMPRTAGFQSLDITDMREQSRLLTEVLMFIGGGSASTAGGIKVTTFAILGWVIWAEARGDPDVVVFARRVPTIVQRQALTVALLAVGTVVGSTILLLVTTPLARHDIMFEVISALGTVGLSANATPRFPEGSQLILVALMLLGRVGPPTLFAALVLRERDRLYRYPEERPIIG